MAYKYFIEDTDTHLWYKNAMLMQLPSVHTFGKGWDCPDPLPSEWWTNEPDKALQFDKADDAIEFMNKGLKRVGSLGQFTEWVQFSGGMGKAKQLVITEHEFVGKEEKV